MKRMIRWLKHYFTDPDIDRLERAERVVYPLVAFGLVVWMACAAVRVLTLNLYGGSS